MKTYQKVEDFLEDATFKQWVLHDDPVHHAYWLKWLAEHPSHVDLVAQARSILLDLNSVGKNWDLQRREKIFSSIKSRLDAEHIPEEKASYSPYSPYKPLIERRVKTIIGIFLFAAFLAGWLQIFLPEEKKELVTAEDKQEEWIFKTNPKGQKSIFQLADGSSVTLNADSELRFGSDFGQGHRDVYLEGEAFFEVASDDALPFKVHSGDLVTTALGTSFNINSYEEENVRVQLATGKVRVYKEALEEQSVYLVPGEEVTVGLDHKLNKRKFDPANSFHWKKGILLFERTSFQEVVVALERWYAVELLVKNLPQKDIKISGEFNNTHLRGLLESLGYAYGFDYSIKNKEVIIQFKTQN